MSITRTLLCGSLLLLANAVSAQDAPTPATTTRIAPARDLHRDALHARRDGVPILIVFTRPDCRYCDRVIHYYLEPIQRNADTTGTVIIRRMDITGDETLRDFHGVRTTARAFARARHIDFAPTVVVYRPDGRPAAKPLVGLGPEDYYGGYLDAAIHAGRAQAKANGAAP
jgi:thioredoxin-related protein